MSKLRKGPVCPRYERTYVTVTSVYDSTGHQQPTYITWDTNHTYRIEAVTDFRPAGTLDSSMGCHYSDCYTIKIRGQTRYLYFERTDPRLKSVVGRWFVLTPAN